MSNFVENTFLNILILRIVDPYYYSKGIFTNMLTDVSIFTNMLTDVSIFTNMLIDVRVSCFSFSIDSINNPISIDSGSEGFP